MGAAFDQLRVDGGMVVNDWLCQFLADVLGRPVERPVIVETTALGAAVLAALGGKLVDDLDSARRMWGLEKEFQPAMAAAERERLLNRDGAKRSRARCSDRDNPGVTTTRLQRVTWGRSRNPTMSA